ncbi:hypothetical protein [Pseudomonas tohonis]|uniref:hypothetical protein n=1 Tax=Pseudomonas tohonis TaxID=2725477 RepID=UPI0021D8AF80|nr:hypothetical protein [Pseudomonas tohonis]UXY53502.1 hypothetical protein N9L84_02640 [Pseudomonas tohonis]
MRGELHEERAASRRLAARIAELFPGYRAERQGVVIGFEPWPDRQEPTGQARRQAR